MSTTLVIVESPNKVKKIQAYLGPTYRVAASVGHICDLPAKEYGVDLASFEESYEMRKADVVSRLRGLARGATAVLLATDPDREGEAIAWHLARELRLKMGAGVANRIEFREITDTAIKAALAAARPIHQGRVDAQRSRRVLDRIIGFDVSREICWPAGAQSAGRVQTPALHILCERERAIRAFVPVTYWTVGVPYAEGLEAFVPEETEGAAAGAAADAPEAVAEDAAAESAGEKKAGRRPRRFTTRAEADAIVAEAARHPHIVSDVDERTVDRRPELPYTTSTLQQDASRKLRISASRTMELAQMLFEVGYISYHRTDSTRLSDEAVEMAREYIARTEPQALPQGAATKGKGGAQDAHEAIRPTHVEGDDSPPPAAADLYAMIKARFLASQCRPARFRRTTIRIMSGTVPWLAEGSVLVDKGFLVFWGPYARQDDTVIPAVAVGQTLKPGEYKVEERKTTPPPRYDTGSLIRKLELSGIGRPSTFAAIIDTLLRRSYVEEVKAGRGKEVLQPTDLGLKTDALLSATMPELVSEDYTADMEAALDSIEHGRGPGRVPYLRQWHTDFRRTLEASLPRAEQYRLANNMKAAPRGGGVPTGEKCDRCGVGEYVKIKRKTGKGSFLACDDCKMTRDVKARVIAGGCTKCGSALIERKSRTGTAFMGCVRYGAAERPCDYVANADGTPRLERGAPRYTRVETDKTCPKCSKHTLAEMRPNPGVQGEPFYACPDTACGFRLTVGFRRHKSPCPTCGTVVIERRTRAGDRFWGCARYPDCRWTAPWTGASPSGGGSR